jgi:hypothetical protein
LFGDRHLPSKCSGLPSMTYSGSPSRGQPPEPVRNDRATLRGWPRSRAFSNCVADSQRFQGQLCAVLPLCGLIHWRGGDLLSEFDEVTVGIA